MLDSIRKILVPTDFSELSEVALRTAAAFARQDDASVHLLHSIRLPVPYTTFDANVPRAIWEGIRKGTTERMYESQYLLEEAGVSQVDLIVAEANQPAEAIERSVAEIDADLVIMATHGRRGVKHAFLGSVTERAIRRSPAPVLAVKGEGITRMPLERLLLPIDFSTDSHAATALAGSLAKRSNAHIDLMHVLDPLPDHLRVMSAAAVEFDDECRATAVDRLQEIGAELRKDGLSVKTHLPDGHAPEVIAEQSDQLGSDLIVMGTHGYSGLNHALVGSITERTMRLAACSVLTTKTDAG